MTEFDNIQLNIEDHTANILFNRPKTLNALNSAIIEELSKVLREIEEDDTIRVVILKGAGKAFVAGADIKEMTDMSSSKSAVFSKLTNDVFVRLENLSAITIAVIDGFALGGGAELALAADIRVGTKNALFGFPEVGLGIVPGFGGTQRLPNVVGIPKAKELIVTAQNIKAEEAKEIGLLNSLVDTDELEDTVEKLKNSIIRNAPLAVEKAKKLVDASAEISLEKGIQFEANVMESLFYTEDRSEGMNAFMEKRKPNFKRK